MMHHLLALWNKCLNSWRAISLEDPFLMIQRTATLLSIQKHIEVLWMDGCLHRNIHGTASSMVLMYQPILIADH